MYNAKHVDARQINDIPMPFFFQARIMCNGKC